MSKFKISKRLKIGGRLLLYATIFAVTIEISARVDDCLTYEAPLFSHYTDDRLTFIDADGLLVNTPNSQFERWQVNRLGFRGPEPTLSKPDSVMRIICLGQSESYGLTESAGKDWPSQMSVILQDKGRFEVINTSILGIPFPQYIPYLKKYVLKFDPDMIIFFISSYNIVNQLERCGNRERPPAKMGEDDRAERVVNVRSVIEGIRILPKLKQTIIKFLPSSLVQTYQIWKTKRGLRQTEAWALKGKPPKDSVPQKYLSHYRENIEELITFATNQGIDVIIGSYPVLLVEENIDHYPVLHSVNRSWVIEYSLKGMIDITTKIDSVTRHVAEDHSIGFVDNRSSPPHDKLHYVDGVHYTDAGANIVASNMARKILEYYPDSLKY